MASKIKMIKTDVEKLSKSNNRFVTQLKLFGRFFRSFLSISSVHGLGQISENRHPFERCLWVSIVGFAIYGIVVLSGLTITRYQLNPTVISIERDHFAWNTSFPPITICPTNKMNEDALNKYISAAQTENRTALRQFLITLSQATYNTFDKVTHYDGISPNQYMPILMNLKFEFKPTLTNSGDTKNIYNFRRIISEMGICYSFNSQLDVYSSPEYWANEFWHVVRGQEILNINPLDGEVFANCGNLSTGLTIYVHGPFEVADSASKATSSEDGFFLQLYLTALTIFSSDRTRSLAVNQRKCRFYDESNLPHSPVYSYVLCRMECRLNLARQLCGCIPHFYRILRGDVICDVKGMHCLGRHKERLITLKKECSCLPNCEEVNYVIEDSDSRRWFLGSNLQWGLKEYPRMRLKRDVIFGFTDFLVYIGGMAGLFLGCSVLSFIEILYFFSIRLYWYLKKSGNIRSQSGYNSVAA